MIIIPDDPFGKHSLNLCVYFFSEPPDEFGKLTKLDEAFNSTAVSFGAAVFHHNTWYDAFRKKFP